MFQRLLLLISLLGPLKGSSGLFIQKGKTIIHPSDNTKLISNIDEKDRDWVNEIKEEIRLSKLVNPRVDKGQSDDLQVLTFGAKSSNGEICQRRVEMVVSQVYDEKIECKDTLIQKCVSGYTTKYKAVKVKQCTEDFKKSCHITYVPVNVQKEVKICEDKYERVCNSQRNIGEEICVDVPSSVCVSSVDSETTNKEVECTQEIRKICGPDTCALEKSEVCVKETKDIIQEIPQEKCDIHPTHTCRNVTKLVPNLRNKENCLEIPKEICQTLKVNHRSVEKPVSNIICKQSKGKWGVFGRWSRCEGKCGEGSQYRERKCETKDCNGFAIESRACDTGVPCKGEQPIKEEGLDASSFEIGVDQIVSSEEEEKNNDTEEGTTESSELREDETTLNPTERAPDTTTQLSTTMESVDTTSTTTAKTTTPKLIDETTTRITTPESTDETATISLSVENINPTESENGSEANTNVEGSKNDSPATTNPSIETAFRFRQNDGLGKCARNGVRFISNDNIKVIHLPPNGDVSDKVRLCEILCLQREGCQFYHTDVGNQHSSCTIFRAISDIIEGAPGFVAGIRHCLEGPSPIEEEIFQSA